MFDPVAAIQEFIRHPSVSTDPSYQEGMSGARDYIAGLLRDMGLKVDILETPLHPVVLAHREGPADWPHVIIYGHYDVQPADPFELWNTPPFEPEIRDGRIYGRGAADNKGPLMVHVAAVARLLEQQPDLPLRITFLIEGEEEIGSPSFPQILRDYKDRLQADFVLLTDTLSPSTEQIAITTALRGIVTLEVELTGPSSDLHSGIHGGAIMNPIVALSRLCATLHHEDGSVNVPGFYDDVVETHAWEKEEIARLSSDQEAYQQRLGVNDFYTAKGVPPAEATRLWPTLEFNGIGGGYQGEGSKTIIPSKAFVKISCRLVANQTADDIAAKVTQALEDRCPPQVKLKITRGHNGNPYRVVPPHRPDTPEDQDPSLARAFDGADAAIREIFPHPPLYLREGGSVPIIGDLKRVLGLDSLMFGMFTPVDNLHAPNESFDLQMFERGIGVSERILRAVAEKR